MSWIFKGTSTSGQVAEYFHGCLCGSEVGSQQGLIPVLKEHYCTLLGDSCFKKTWGMTCKKKKKYFKK